MSEDNVEATRRAIEAWLVGDVAGFLRYVDPQVEFVELPAFGTKTYHGHDGLMAALNWWPRQWDDFRAELTQVIDASDDQVVTVSRNYGREKRSGVELEEEVAMLTTIRAGRAIRVEMFRTASEALEAVRLRE